MLDRFHSKLHKYNHFTNPVANIYDSASDPIAAPSDPFQGDFHIVGTLSATNVYALCSVSLGTDPNRGQLKTANLTALRTYTFPNNTGTVVLDSTITSYVSSISASIQNNGLYVSSKTLWVDALSGNDLTGKRERADLPFQTLVGAQSYAVTGDTIFVRNGTYTGSNLGVDGVNWFFDVGTTLSANNPTVPFFNYSSKSYNVFGVVAIKVTGNITTNNGTVVIADFSGSNGTKDMVFEFDKINVTNGATPSTEPTSSLFGGTFGTKNVIVRGNRIFAQYLNVFGGIKTLTPGVQYFKVEMSGSIAGQTLFYDSLQRLTGYINAPTINVTDYIYNDGGTTDAVDYVYINCDNLFGSIYKNNTTGPLHIVANTFTVAPAVSGIQWQTMTSGDIHIDADVFSTTIQLDVSDGARFDFNRFSITDNLSSAYAIGYIGGITFNAQVASVTYSAGGYTIFNSNADSSKLVVNINELDNVSVLGINIVNVQYNSNLTRIRIDQMVNGGQFLYNGGSNRAKIDVGASDDTLFNITVPDYSNGSYFYVSGLYNSYQLINVLFVAASGHTDTRLYLDGGTTFACVGNGNNIDCSAVMGDPLQIYCLGTVITNQVPVDPSWNFNIMSGGFESGSAIAVPTFS